MNLCKLTNYIVYLFRPEACHISLFENGSKTINRTKSMLNCHLADNEGSHSLGDFICHRGETEIASDFSGHVLLFNLFITSMYLHITSSSHRCIIISMHHRIDASSHRCIITSIHHHVDASSHRCISSLIYHYIDAS